MSNNDLGKVIEQLQSLNEQHQWIQEQYSEMLSLSHDLLGEENEFPTVPNEIIHKMIVAFEKAKLSILESTTKVIDNDKHIAYRNGALSAVTILIKILK